MKFVRIALLLLVLATVQIVPTTAVYAGTAPTEPSKTSKQTGPDVFSGVCGTSGSSDSALCQDSNPANNKGNPLIGPNGVIRKAVTILSVIAGAVAVIIIIISGMRLVLSGGDQATVKQSREGILYALIGLIVIVVAQPIIAFVLNKIYNA